MEDSNKFFNILDISNSCFVFASAGSGKTKILVDRYIKSLIFGVKPQDILCITYTNAAVFEMEERISQKLKEFFINGEEYTKKYLQDELYIKNISENDVRKASKLFFLFQDELSQMKILTIHSFCQSLLQQFPLETGIIPNFRIIEDIEAKKLIQQAKDKVLDSIQESVIENLIKSLSLYTIENFINQIYGMLSNFQEFFNKHRSLEYYKENMIKFCKLSEILTFTTEQQQFIDKNFKHENLNEHYLTKDGKLRKKIPYKDSEISRQIADIVYENFILKNKLETVEKTNSFLLIVKSILDEYQNLKAEQNVIDFTDVLFKTKYLLTESYAKEFVVSKIFPQIKAIMIDEAQDVSKVQWDLINIFADDIYSEQKTDKTMFIVGDIKQSIYRFQGADSSLLAEFYNKTSKFFQQCGKKLNVVYLDKNYRSLPKILCAVDQTFSGEISQNLCSEIIKYKIHIPHRTDNSGHFDVITIAKNEEMEEAEQIAHNILHLMTEDSLILTRSRDNLSENIIKNLQNLGVKISLPNKVNLSQNLLIMDLLAIADICINNDNDYALCCILKSQYIFEAPLNNDDLYCLCHNRICSVFENLKHYFPEKYEYLMEFISKYNKNELCKFFYSIVIKLYNITQNDKYIVDIFMDEVTKFARNYSENIEKFLEYFMSNNIEIGNQNIEKNVLRLSTIHSSKGLEADTVFLLDYSLKADKAKTNFLFSDNWCFIKPSQRKSFSEIDVLSEKEYVAEEQELHRLLYVAMTRARDNLYIFSNEKSSGKTVSSLIKSKCFGSYTEYDEQGS